MRLAITFAYYSIQGGEGRGKGGREGSGVEGRVERGGRGGWRGEGGEGCPLATTILSDVQCESQWKYSEHFVLFSWQSAEIII